MCTLVALAVGADRIILLVAQRDAAATIQSSQHLHSTPSVSVRGFPFLTQLLGGTLNKVDVTLNDFLAGDAGRPVRVARLWADLRRVHVSGFSSAWAETVTASALINYNALSERLGVKTRFGGASADGLGRIVATQSLSVFGQQISGAASAEVHVGDANMLSFVDPRASVVGLTLPADVVDAFTQVFATSIALRRLPFGLVLTSVRASMAGVTIVLTGTNVTYR